MEPLLNQIIDAQIDAFMTVKANIKENTAMGIVGKSYNQKEVWTNEQHGILPMLVKLCPAFKKVKLPNNPHQAALQAVDRFLFTNRSL